jgi:hypothetical protein
MKHIRHTKVIAAAVAVTLAAALAVTLAALAEASQGISGTYVTTVRSAGALSGSYRVTFSPGRFELVAPFGIVGHGTDTVRGSRITLHGPGKCGSPGVYEFRRSGSYLSFRRLNDPCPRAAVLTAHALRKA